MAAKIMPVLLIACLAGGCVTNIHTSDEPIPPSKVPFGTFTTFEIRPLTVTQMGEGKSNQEAVARVETELMACMSSTLGSNGPQNGHTLVVEPIIQNLKKVGTATRIFAGALAGSSAILLNVRFTDATTNEVVADPTFYARAAAMGAAWTFGATDNSMLGRVVTQACDYTRNNL